jgi:hypothetical protein
MGPEGAEKAKKKPGRLVGRVVVARVATFVRKKAFACVVQLPIGNATRREGDSELLQLQKLTRQPIGLNVRPL